MRLEEAVELLPAGGGPELLVMELATGGERTIDGIADGPGSSSGTRRRGSRCAPGSRCTSSTLDDPALMDLADRVVSALGIEHFFNIQLVGDLVIEVNPRISTIVYQQDLNLPYLGVKRALGEVADEELRALAARVRAGTDGAPLLRPGRVGRVSAGDTAWPAVPSLTPAHPGTRDDASREVLARGAQDSAERANPRARR